MTWRLRLYENASLLAAIRVVMLVGFITYGINRTNDNWFGDDGEREGKLCFLPLCVGLYKLPAVFDLPLSCGAQSTDF